MSLRSRGVAESEASMLLSNECVRMYVTVMASTTLGQLYYVSKVYAISQDMECSILSPCSFTSSQLYNKLYGISDEFR